MEISELIRQAGTAEAAIETFLEGVASGRYPFPYQKYYLPPPGVMFEALRRSTPTYLSTRLRMRAYYPFRKPLDCTFRGRPLAVMSSTEHYQQFDALSDHFMEEVRIRAHRCDAMAPADFWQNRELLRPLLAEIFASEPKLTPRVVRRKLYDHIAEAKQFRPSWVRGIVLQLFPRPAGLKFLDISAGWGDRLIAAMSLGMDYTGFDPNTALIPGHQSLIAAFGQPERHTVQPLPFEEAELPADTFDLCLTSPPFFDLEVYSEEATQSVQRYPELGPWLEGFLFPALRKAWAALKLGGYLALHLGDTYRFRICDAANHFIDEFLPGSMYAGVIGLVGDHKRPTAVWIWQKCGRKLNAPVFKTPFAEMRPEYVANNHAEITLALKKIDS